MTGPTSPTGEAPAPHGERRKGRQRRAPRPLDRASLDQLALGYAARFATTRVRLARYLGRKLAERGWDGEPPPDIAALVERLAELGYVNDGDYALARARLLGRRGFGQRRVAADLRAAGIGDDDGAAARELAAGAAVEAVLRLVDRKRIGPFAASGWDDPAQRRRWLGALARAGHPPALAHHLVRLCNPLQIDKEVLAALVNSGA